MNNCIFSEKEYQAMIEDQGDKKCIEYLYKFNFPNEVINWVRNEICNVKRRIHSYDNNTMAAYVILGYNSLGYEPNIDLILDIMGIVNQKKKVLELISGLSTKNTPIHYTKETIISRIIHPSEYIEIIFNTYCLKFNDVQFDKNSIVLDIIHFTNIFVAADERFLNFEAKTSACTFVFFYIENFSSDRNKKKLPCKSDFKNIKFSFTNCDEKINPTNFDDCLELINENYKNFVSCCDDFMLNSLIFFNF